MHSLIMILLLAFVAQAYAKDALDMWVDKLVDNLLDRNLDMWSTYPSDLDSATLRKPTHLAIRSQMSLRPLLPLRTQDDFALHWTHYKPQVRPKAMANWVQQQVNEMDQLLKDKASDVRSFPAFSVWPMSTLDAAAVARREALRHECDRAEAFTAQCELPIHLPHAEAVAALADGLSLAKRLPGASSQALADVHTDVLACVALWAQETGRERACVQVKLLRSSMCTKLHLDYVDARVLCTLYGKGTEWLSPGVLHAAASLAVTDGGSALGDVLKDVALATTSPRSLHAAQEREAVLIRGPSNPRLRNGQSMLHRSPSVDGCCGEWRLLIKVDEGSGDLPTQTEANDQMVATSA